MGCSLSSSSSCVTISPVGGPIGLIHQPRNFKYYEVFFADLCPHGVLEQLWFGCPSCNFGQLWEIAKIQNGCHEKDSLQNIFFFCMCNTSDIGFLGVQNSFLVLFFQFEVNFRCYMSFQLACNYFVLLVATGMC